MTGSNGREVQAEGRDGQISQRAGEVVEPLGLGRYGRDCDGRLDGKCCAHARHQGLEKGVFEVSEVEKALKQRHLD